MSWMCEQAADISVGMRICDSCRKSLARTPACLPEVEYQPSVLPEPESSLQSDSPSPPCREELQFEASKSLKQMNQYLEDVGKTPVTRKKLRTKKYLDKKLDEVTEMVKKVTIGDTDSVGTTDECEMLEQLKEKFHATKESSVKIQILTVLPKSWSTRRIEREFSVSHHISRKVKSLVKEKGILSLPDPKPGHSLPQETADLAVTFYESDESSRMMPGKKDFVSIKDAGGRKHIQKRLVLCNLKELYQHFKDKHPSVKIGFSKFAELRPRNCVLAGASGTHSVCVCTIHQNVKLMVLGARLPELSSELKNYRDYLARIICNPPLPQCHLGECDSCPGVEEIEEHLITILDHYMIENVTFKQWTSVDRSSLETITMSADEFVELFSEKLKALCPHSFIATQQSRFFSECKSTLKPGEIVVSADFSENYAFVLQDAAQGFHWNNAQATIHPFVVYYKESGEEHHLSFVVISDCLLHDTVAVYLYQKRLIAHLRETLTFSPKQVFYFSDGAAAQYKNRKNFINLCHHEVDFGIPAQWHFSATSHGKGACDGLGGTVKRLAARASLQRPTDDQIMTPFQLYKWASENIPAVTFNYCTTTEYDMEKSFLEKRFEKSQTIPGTRSLHSFIPISTDTLQTRRYSESKEFREQRVTRVDDDLEIDDVSGYVTCVHTSKWWLACVLEVDKESAEVRVTLLHPCGLSRSYKYPSKPDTLSLPLSSLLVKVDARTTTGRTYTISPEDKKRTVDKFKKTIII